MVATTTGAVAQTQRLSLLRVLGPAHVWALGVGIVLVGEYMGWNFSVGKGGMIAGLVACWVAGVLYTCVAMIDSEVTSTVAAAGGQYAQAKHIVGPLMAFNVGLFLVMAYTMLEAGNAITIGFLLDTVANMQGHEGLNQQPFIILAIMFLAWLNYRGVLATLNFNFVITAIAFLAIIVLFLSVQFGGSAIPLDFSAVTRSRFPMAGSASSPPCISGFGITSASKGTCQAAEEVRSPARSLPYGTMAGIMTLIIAATLTWYVCSGLIPWEYLGQAGTPLFDAGAGHRQHRSHGPALRRDDLLDPGLGERLHQRRLTGLVLYGARPLPADLVRSGASALSDAVPVHRLPGSDRADLRARGAARPGGDLLDPVRACSATRS
jgi:ethanolamine permease